MSAPKVRTVMIGDKRYHLPFVDLIPFDPDQDAALGREIEEAGEVLVPIIANKEKSKNSDVWVSDGAHRVLHSARLKLDAPPIRYRKFADEDDERDFVLRVNLERRHLTPEQLADQVRERNERIAERRRKGESERAIAEAEGVSKTTVHNVVTGSTGQGVTSSPESGRVKGKDGKDRPAQTALCKRCKRMGAPVKNCKQCEGAKKDAAQKKAAAAKKKEDAKNAEAKVDAFKNVVPAKRQDALFDPWVQEAIDFLAQTSESFRQERLIDLMSKKGKKNPFFNAKDFVDGCGFVIQYLDQLLEHLKEFRPAAVCPACAGEGCGACKLSGLVPRKVYEDFRK